MQSGRAFGCLLLALAASASDAGGEDWLNRSRQILEHAGETPAPGWLRAKPDPRSLEAVRRLLNNSPKPADLAQRLQPSAAAPVGERVYLFLSFSIPEEDLRGLLAEADRPDVIAVIRGVPAGESIPAAVMRLRNLVDPDNPPDVHLDPLLFRRFGIQQVPTLVWAGEGGRSVRARGAVTVDWFKRRVEALDREDASDLGDWGPVYPIAERDLVEEIQARMAAVDWAAMREAAVRNYWQQVEIVELPRAREAREFTVDPTVRITEDIVAPDGRVLAVAGQRYNPLDILPLTQTVVVFDGTHAPQVELARNIAREGRRQGRGVTLITTRVDRARGWDAFNVLEAAFEQPVYLLREELAVRLGLEHVPSTVEARGRHLLIREIPVED